MIKRFCGKERFSAQGREGFWIKDVSLLTLKILRYYNRLISFQRYKLLGVPQDFWYPYTPKYYTPYFPEHPKKVSVILGKPDFETPTKVKLASFGIRLLLVRPKNRTLPGSIPNPDMGTTRDCCRYTNSCGYSKALLTSCLGAITVGGIDLKHLLKKRIPKRKPHILANPSLFQDPKPLKTYS